MKSQLISGMRNFVLGGGTGVALALTGLSMWTGTTDLQAIKDAVTQLEGQSSFVANEVVNAYRVDVQSANAEIGEYKDALAQANNNITSLITAYENKVEEMEQAQASAEQDLADLQAELTDMENRLNAQYEVDMNAIIEKANEQIDAANSEVTQARYEIQDIVDNSSLNVGLEEFINNAGVPEVDMGGDKTVTDISGVIGE